MKAKCTNENPSGNAIIPCEELKTSLNNMAAWRTLQTALWILACWDSATFGSRHHHHLGKYTSVGTLHILRWWLNHPLMLSDLWLHEVGEQSLLDSLLTSQHHQSECAEVCPRKINTHTYRYIKYIFKTRGPVTASDPLPFIFREMCHCSHKHWDALFHACNQRNASVGCAQRGRAEQANSRRQ